MRVLLNANISSVNNKPTTNQNARVAECALNRIVKYNLHKTYSA